MAWGGMDTIFEKLGKQVERSRSLSGGVEFSHILIDGLVICLLQGVPYFSTAPKEHVGIDSQGCKHIPDDVLV